MSATFLIWQAMDVRAGGDGWPTSDPFVKLQVRTLMMTRRTVAHHAHA